MQPKLSAKVYWIVLGLDWILNGGGFFPNRYRKSCLSSGQIFMFRFLKSRILKLLHFLYSDKDVMKLISLIYSYSMDKSAISLICNSNHFYSSIAYRLVQIYYTRSVTLHVSLARVRSVAWEASYLDNSWILCNSMHE